MKLLALLALFVVSEAVPVRRRNLGPPRAVPFVVGGNPININNVPWQASLQILGNHFCGGVIVRANRVLTAAHCVQGQDWTLIQVRAGIDRLSSSAGQAQNLASQPLVHWEWDGFTWWGDLAILELANNFNINLNVDTAQLVGNGEILNGNQCTVTGWGRTDGRDANSQSDQLLEAQMNAISVTECNQRISDPDVTVDARRQCAWGSGIRTTCTGDNGGPLNCLSSGQWKVGGVGTFFVGTADDSCLRSQPSIFTSISYYRAWIDENLP